MPGNDKSGRQLVAIGYLIFNRTKAYMDALKTWNANPSLNKIFENLKRHLRTEYHAFRRVGALTIQESTINANMLRDVTEHSYAICKLRVTAWCYDTGKLYTGAFRTKKLK